VNPQIHLYRSRLNEVANAVSLDVGRVPVDLGLVCKWFGATVVSDRSIGWRHAYLSFENGQLERPIVTVGLDPDSAYARFCIAHELAHLILTRDFNVLPKGRSQYWQHEILCDEFARQILVPKRYMHELMLGRPTSGTALLMRTLDIESETHITWVHGAKRLADFRDSTGFFRLEMTSETSFKIMGSTLPNYRGRSMVITSKVQLFDSLKQMLGQAIAHGRARVTCLEPTLFEEKLSFLREYKQVYAICRRRAAGSNEVLLAVDR